jgi:hypothetical protein
MKLVVSSCADRAPSCAPRQLNLRDMPAARRTIILVAATVWIVGAAAGLGWLADYSATPGAAASSQMTWPAGSRLPEPKASFQLVLFLHPHCPCSLATLGELERALVNVEDRCEVVLVFYRPARADPGEWAGGPLRERAARLPHVQIVDDDDGREALRFGATTSGHAMLFDASSRLVFSGGLTASRGHEGDNAGRAGVAAIFAGARHDAPTTPVYGCSLRSGIAAAESARTGVWP